MKKFIALLLSLLMVFSTANLVFAEGENAEPESTTVEAVEDTETPIDEEFNFEDVPLWVVKLALKLAKFVVKISFWLGKMGLKTGIIDEKDVIDVIVGLFGGQGQEDESTTLAPETTAQEAAQAA